MAVQDDLTTLVCLFHHQDQAQAAVEDLLKAGIPQDSITRFGGAGTEAAATDTTFLSDLGIPERDEKHLYEGVRNGGSIVAVSAIYDHVDKVEDIFGAHKAEKIDETDTDDGLATGGATTIPVVAEELLVGKRTVDQGGVRVYRRVVEMPVEDSVDLREEHISIDRRPVDRAVTDSDRAFGERSIELTETAEEAVVGKSARVVEEVLVGKEYASHTEHIQDTVRHTEVEVEEIAPNERIN